MENTIISLTTYPARIGQVSKVLDCLVAQTVPADKIILYLAEDEFVGTEGLGHLARYEKYGFEIHWCKKSLKPHTKYYYAMQEYPDDIIITVDDDHYYKKTMVEELLRYYPRYPRCVLTRRAHLVTRYEDGNIAPYSEWFHEYNKYVGIPRMDLFATACGGTLYPPHIFGDEVFKEDIFMRYSMYADDIWLKVMALLSGIPVVKVIDSFDDPEIEEGKPMGLWTNHNFGDNNSIYLNDLLAIYNGYHGEGDTLIDRLFADGSTYFGQINKASFLRFSKDMHGHGDIVIYGAGIVAKRVYKAIQRCGSADKVKAFVVNDTSQNPDGLFGVQVRDCREYINKKEKILVAVSHQKQKEIFKELLRQGVEEERIICLDWGLDHALRRLENKQEIAVAFISDDRYAVNTSVTISSLRANRNVHDHYHVYFISNHIEKKKLKKIQGMETDNFKISIIEYGFDDTEFLKKDIGASQTAILKFLLADILVDLDKVIYLDGDMIVQSDLRGLFEIPLENTYAAVVRDLVAEKSSLALKKLKSDLDHYFNSGMMVLDLRKIRKEGISKQLFAYRRNGINHFMDQDAFNVVFNGNVTFISCIYNYLTTLNERLADQEINKGYGLEPSKREPGRLLEAKLIHFAGTDKPWKVRMPYHTDIFMEYYSQSPFYDEKLFRPKRRIIQETYLFPFGSVMAGTDIVLWGAGRVGQSYYEQVTYTKYCKIVGWVDKKWRTYKDGDKVIAPKMIGSMKVDYIVIAVKCQETAVEIRETLKKMGVDEEKIIWRYPLMPPG